MKNTIQDSEQFMPKAPQLVRRRLIEGIPGNQFVTGEQYHTVLLSGTDLKYQVANHVSISEALFKHVNMMETQLEGIQMVDVRLTSCDLMNANWYKGGLYRTEFHDCRITGLLAGEAHFEDVLFKDCKVDLAQFRFATFKAVRFVNCDLGEVDLLGANLSQTALLECNLSGAELSNSTLRQVDLTTCNLDGARVGMQELQGATINVQQAIALIQAQGITVSLNAKAL